MKFIDLFAGIGGFRYGLEKAGDKKLWRKKRKESSLLGYNKSNNSSQSNKRQPTFSCVYSNEWDKYAAQIYKKHYGECNTADITQVITQDIPDHDLLCAGFPCQSFSIAGKRKGFKDTRGTLFFDIARILSEKRPRLILLENVKGLLSHDQGKTFQTILGVLSNLGYGVEWQVLNSKHFGVPQNRERVFIVGHLGEGSERKVFPIGGTDKENVEVEVRPKTRKPVSPTLSTPSGGHHIPTIRQPLRYLTRNQKNIEGDYAYTVDGSNTGGVKVHPAIDANYYKGMSNQRKGLVQNTRIRRLTPTECERLQGFPDGYTEGLSDTQRYKCLGNAVTTNVITAIGEKLI